MQIFVGPEGKQTVPGERHLLQNKREVYDAPHMLPFCHSAVWILTRCHNMHFLTGGLDSLDSHFQWHVMCAFAQCFAVQWLCLSSGF